MKTEKENMEEFTKELMATCHRLSDIADRLGLTLAGIRIVTSVDSHDGKGSTSLATAGNGNWHAQRGAVQEWVDGKDAYEAGYHGAQGSNDFDAIQGGEEPDDQGEEWKGGSE